MQLPVFKATRDGLLMAARVAQRHPTIVVGFALFYLVVRIVGYQMLGPPPRGGISFAIVIIQGLLILTATSVVAILIHHEILIGPTRLQSIVSRPALRGLGAYIIDVVALSAMFLILIGSGVGAVLWILGAIGANLQIILAAIPVVSLSVLMLFGGRLWLKLPAQAIGEDLTWRQAWSMGKDNTLRLSVVILLASTLLFWLSELVTAAIGAVSLPLAFVVDGVIWTVLAVVTTALASVCCLYLTVGEDQGHAETTGEPAPTSTH